MESLIRRAIYRLPPRFVADFDSTTGMVRATGRYLRRKDFPVLGIIPPIEPLGAAVNALPKRARELLYIWGGWSEAIPAQHASKVRAEELSRWVVREYPRRRFPAVMIGSSSGAAVHLCAALGIPWLPQTFLIPARRFGGPPR